jgi:restriction endonuclease S subunit
VTLKEEKRSELPIGWVWTSMGELCEHVQKVNPKEKPDSEFKYIEIASINNQKQRITDVSICKGKDAPSRAKQLVKNGDTLFSTVRTYLKNIALVGEDLDGQIASTGFCVIRPTDLINQRMIFYFVQTNDFLNKLTKIQRGTSYPAVRDSDVFAQRFALPPFMEQERIVNKVEELFSFLDEGTESLRKVQAQLKGYRQAVLKAAINGDLTKEWRNNHSESLLSHAEYAKVIEREKANTKNSQLLQRTEKFFQDISLLKELPEGWLYVPLIQVATLHRGFDLPQDKRKNGPYPVVASSSIVGYHNVAKIKGPGVATGRSGTIGEVRYIELDFWPLNTSLYVCDFHGNAPKFVLILLQAMQIQKFLSRTGVPTLNRNIIPPIQVPLPQLPEQLEIISKTEQLFSVLSKPIYRLQQLYHKLIG